MSDDGLFNDDLKCFYSADFHNPVYRYSDGMFKSNYTNHPLIVSVEQSEEVITEQSGYMSTKEMVERLVLAGQRLYDYRHGILDMERESIDDDEDVEDQMASTPYDEDPVDASIRIDSEMAYRQSKKASQNVENASGAVELKVPEDQVKAASSGPSEGPPDA